MTQRSVSGGDSQAATQVPTCPHGQPASAHSMPKANARDASMSPRRRQRGARQQRGESSSAGKDTETATPPRGAATPRQGNQRGDSIKVPPQTPNGEQTPRVKEEASAAAEARNPSRTCSGMDEPAEGGRAKRSTSTHDRRNGKTRKHGKSQPAPGMPGENEAQQARPPAPPPAGGNALEKLAGPLTKAKAGKSEDNGRSQTQQDPAKEKDKDTHQSEDTSSSSRSAESAADQDFQIVARAAPGSPSTPSAVGAAADEEGNFEATDRDESQ